MASHCHLRHSDTSVAYTHVETQPPPQPSNEYQRRPNRKWHAWVSSILHMHVNSFSASVGIHRTWSFYTYAQTWYDDILDIQLDHILQDGWAQYLCIDHLHTEESEESFKNDTFKRTTTSTDCDVLESCYTTDCSIATEQLVTQQTTMMWQLTAHCKRSRWPVVGRLMCYPESFPGRQSKTKDREGHGNRWGEQKRSMTLLKSSLVKSLASCPLGHSNVL